MIVMTTYREIIDAMGGVAIVAAVLDIKGDTAQALRDQDRMPAYYWKDLVWGASSRGIEGVTLGVLAEIADRERKAKLSAKRSQAAA